MLTRKSLIRYAASLSDFFVFQNSGSASGSCSQSDSSDTDSSSSSQESSSRSPSPEFSVTSTQANSLRLTIAAVRKSCGSPIDKPTKTCTELKTNNKQPILTKSSNLSSSSDSPCSRSDSDSDSDSEAGSSKVEVKKIVKKSVGGMMRTRSRRVAVDKKNEKGLTKTAGSPKNVNRVKHRQKRKKVSLDRFSYIRNVTVCCFVVKLRFDFQ